MNNINKHVFILSIGATPEQNLMQMRGQSMALPNGSDLRDVTVLSKGDWDRIQYQLNKQMIEQERLRRIREDKDKMHELSKEKVKNWTNTIVVSLMCK